ncbi:MAG TPA: flagellar basal body-associated FliL family protein [Kofleriaceae bacterium]|jgi:flagellar FliL protein
MSEEPAPKPADSGAPKAKGSKAVVGLLLLNLGATGFVTFKTVTAAPAATIHEEAKVKAPETQAVSGPVVALDPFVVNLDEPGISRYLKITLQVELLPDADHDFDKSKQLVRDAILSHLSGLHLKDTLGVEAKDKLRADLTAKLQALLGPDKVRRIFFQEFVVQ